MYLPMPLLISATVNLALAPLRRIRLLMSVEGDLAEEGVVPANAGDSAGPAGSGKARPARGGFGGAWGAARFLFQLGGIRAFYRGAALEYAGMFAKYLIQVAVVVPICRRLPLQMQRSYMLTTLLHTIILFFPIAPVQLFIDTIVTNACSDFVRKDAVGVPSTAAPSVAEVDGSQFRFRFHSLWEAAAAAWRTLPILPLVDKLMLLDFAGRYVSSLVFNKVIGFFYDKLMGDNGGDPSRSRALTTMMRVVPPLVSIGYGLLTYPVVNLPFSHFVRVRLHEREAAEKAKATEEDEREYRRPSNANSSGANRPNRSFHGSRSVRLSAYPRPDEEDDRLLADRLVELLCHWDVRDYLYFTYEQWGLRGLYRGYSMQMAAIAISAASGVAVTELLMHIRRRLRHAVQVSASSTPPSMTH